MPFGLTQIPKADLFLFSIYNPPILQTRGIILEGEKSKKQQLCHLRQDSQISFVRTLGPP